MSIGPPNVHLQNDTCPSITQSFIDSSQQNFKMKGKIHSSKNLWHNHFWWPLIKLWSPQTNGPVQSRHVLFQY